MRLTRLTILALAALATAPALGAQITPPEDDTDPNDAAAYFALSMTPLGTLPPMRSAREVGLGRPGGMGLRFQFSNIDEEGDMSRRSFAGGIDFAVGTGTFGLTAGYLDVACDTDEAEAAGVELDCGGAIMGAATIGTSLLRTPVGQGNSFDIGLDGGVGFSTGDFLDASGDDGFGGTFSIEMSQSSLSAAVGLPVSLVVRSPGLVIVPMIRPAFGYGRAKLSVAATGFPDEDDTESGTRMMLGGGVSLFFPNQALGINVGVQKIFFEDANTAIGFGVTFGR